MKSFGFTLLELLISMAISSILWVSAVSLTHFYQEKKSEMVIQKILHVLQFARLSAIQHHQYVGICGTEDFKVCHNDWSNGYVVFIPRAPQKIPFTHIGAILYDERKPGQRIWANGGASIAFNHEGKIVQNASIHVNNQSIVIAQSGRARLIKASKKKY